MKLTGEKLRSIREEKGLSIHEISLSLKINSKVLKAIEEGDTSSLPAKTFLRGFVQSYANYLNMDTQKILELFHEEMGSTRPQPIIKPSESIPPGSPGTTTHATPSSLSTSPGHSDSAVAIEKVNSKNQLKAIGISGVMLLLAFLIYAVNSQIERYTKEADVVSTVDNEEVDDLILTTSTSPAAEASRHLADNKPPETTNLPATNNTPSAQPSAQTVTPQPAATTPTATPPSKPTTPQPTATSAQKESLPATSATIATAAPAQKPTTNITSSTTPPPSISTAATVPKSVTPPPTVPTALPKPTVTAQATNPSSSTSTSNVELIVEALEPVEIQYATNATGSTLSKILLKAEQVHTFKSKSGLSLNFSNAGAVNLILNGKDLGVPGKQGQPIQLKY